MYELIAAPPSDDGAAKVTVPCPCPGTADTPVGAPGTPRGVTAEEAADAAPDPATLAAVTVNV